ncbi:hypothetical protein [Streptomyces pakalii]|uniref:DUF1918 domain-containing protein n=1 Tax=Streptomyces pakalii TaxID=3036494 RepID=A0ABT7DHZ1_9ACTN|nr:hypothetical protein [Streptomyces pakalii]MDJ1645430.1 hypothetical protein [Streptomyces pakalii]
MGRQKSWTPRWHTGDLVMPTGEQDHPGDPVGKVLEETYESGVLVLFPDAGHEFHHPDELIAVEPGRYPAAAALAVEEVGQDVREPTADSGGETAEGARRVRWHEGG